MVPWRVVAARPHVNDVIKGPTPDGAEHRDLVNVGAISRPVVNDHHAVKHMLMTTQRKRQLTYIRGIVNTEATYGAV